MTAASMSIQTGISAYVEGHDALMRTLNLGILAHVDAGKTSLTERLLYAAGVIDEIGSVDDGSTQTDTLALERQRGITIKSAVVSFVVDDVTVNLIDTPGHPDFIAEVERVLSVLDGAVLVVSAVEGVQAQTRVLMRTLQRLRIPTLLFVNKIDRAGARRTSACSQAIAEKLTPAIVAMGSARDARHARAPRSRRTARDDAAFAAGLVELLAEHDDALLAAYVDDADAVSYGRLRRELAAQTEQALVHPVFFGSAITGAGVDALTAGIAELLPAADGDADGPSSGTVFKVERGPAGEKIAYVRMFSGTLRDRATGCSSATTTRRKVTAISVFDRGSAVHASVGRRGPDRKLWGLGDVRIGDAIGDARERRGRGTTSRRRRSRRSSFPAAASRQGRAARRARPARRAGPADRPAAGRRPAGDVRVALRRGAEGGDPGDAGRRVRHRRRASARRRRSASSGPIGTGAAVEIIGKRRRTRSSPPSGCASSPRRSALASSSGSRSSWVRCRSRSSRRSRTPCGRRSTRVCTAGRSPTASSR